MAHINNITQHVKLDTDEDPNNWECISEYVDYFTVPIGKYYIGDLCYAVKNSVYDKIWGDKFNYADGIYLRKSDGAIFAMKRTSFGDGVLHGTDGKEYTVDAGHIGIASASICNTNEMLDYFKEFTSEPVCEFDSDRWFMFDSHGNTVTITIDGNDDDY